MDNQLKYYILDSDSIIALIYESETYGRTIVWTGEKVHPNSSIQVYNQLTGEVVADKSLLEFFQSMLPGTEEHHG